MERRGFAHARIADVPAIGAAGDPAFWSDWARDPGYGRRWHSVGRALRVAAFGINANAADAGEELVGRRAWGRDLIQPGRAEPGGHRPRWAG